MRTLGRYLIVCGAILGLTWAAVSVELGGRTVYGHLRSGGVKSLFGGISRSIGSGWTSMKTRWSSWRSGDSAPTRKHPFDGVDAPKAKSQNQRQVALLRDAEKKATPKKTAPNKTAPKKKTRVDERLSRQQKSKLDEIVAARVSQKE